MAQRVVVVALVEGHVALACGVVKARARGGAAREAPKDGAAEGLLRVEPKAWVWPMRWQPAGGALWLAEARALLTRLASRCPTRSRQACDEQVRAGTWPALYCL